MPKASRQARGYGRAHELQRKRWEPQVNAGTVTCWRCRRLIQPGTPWDMGHDDDDRTRYRGPEHQACNRGAAGKKTRDRARRTEITW